jgi:hypothetical protein
MLAVDRPNFEEWMFWDFAYEEIEWRKEFITIIERVIERGDDWDWKELIRFYGYDTVLRTLKLETIYLPDYAIEKACAYFDLKPEELWCYIRKRERPGHWI